MTNKNRQPSVQRIEMKFRLNTSLSVQVKDWARDHLGVDENCNTDAGDTYDINTLYLDTHELDLFHRTGVVGAAKHRIRRYGSEQTLWLETKRKKNTVVRKNRTVVFESDLMPRLASAHQRPSAVPKFPVRGKPDANAFRMMAGCGDAWCGDWFLNRVTDRRLEPAIRIAYRRFARTMTHNGETLRLTIDRGMTASPIDGWNVAGTSCDTSRDLTAFGDCEILELKFHNQMPHLFKKLLRTFAIPASGFSKYRTAIISRRAFASGFQPDQPWARAQRLISMEGVTDA